MLLAVIFIIFLFEGSSVLWANDPNYQPEILYSDHVASNHVALSTPVDVFAFDGVVDITFTVKAYRSVNDLFSFNTRVFCYDEDCSVPGPTLHLKPGETLRYDLLSRSNLFHQSYSKLHLKSFILYLAVSLS